MLLVQSGCPLEAAKCSFQRKTAKGNVAASVVGGELTEKSDELPTRKNPNPELLHQHPIADSVHLT